MPITEKKLECSNSLSDAYERFLKEVEDWIDSCIRAYRTEAPNNGKGQLTYTCAWEPVLRTTQSIGAVEFLVQKRDEIAQHFSTSGQWQHGYWQNADVRHGTEHARLFLAFLLRINPDDETTRSHILDAAEHVGNWADDTPSWFEPANGLYRSLIMGTSVVDEQSMGWNVPDHLNLSHLALVAYEAGGGEQYLDIAQQYGLVWANAVLAEDRLPVGLSVSGPFYNMCRKKEQIYREAIGVAGPLMNDQSRAENLLANGAIEIFLRLWVYSGNEVFRLAAQDILSELLPQLTDPDAGALANAIRYYRNVTGERKYDDLVRTVTDALYPFEICTIGVQSNVMHLTQTPGVGKRLDMPVWFEDLHLRRHNPILLSLAAEINGDARLATISLDMARTYFELARDTMRTGRQNGDAANTVAAVAGGHGRENGSGMVTSVLGSLQEASPYSATIKYG